MSRNTCLPNIYTLTSSQSPGIKLSISWSVPQASHVGQKVLFRTFSEGYMSSKIKNRGDNIFCNIFVDIDTDKCKITKKQIGFLSKSLCFPSINFSSTYWIWTNFISWFFPRETGQYHLLHPALDVKERLYVSYLKPDSWYDFRAKIAKL